MDWAGGETGRRAWLRTMWGNPWEFDSPPAHRSRTLTTKEKDVSNEEKKLYYTWQEFDADTKRIVTRIKRSRNKRFDGVWAPPRGGLPLAVVLSHALDIPLLLKPTRKTLICDDIADTGRTLDQFNNKNIIVTIFYHNQSIVVPNIWIRQKKDKYIVFPWEFQTPA